CQMHQTGNWLPILKASMKNAINAMESHIIDFFGSLNALQYRRMDFDEFHDANFMSLEFSVLKDLIEILESKSSLIEEAGSLQCLQSN
ncbi:hypothetical protein S83_022210, partial [Arachis hypogaea]